MITLVGTNSVNGAASLTLPAHQAGDLIVICATRTSSTPPTVPEGWTTVDASGANNSSSSLGYLVASDGSTVSGTWTNATMMMAHVYRGHNGIGGNAVANNVNTAALTYPAVTMVVGDGSSWVAAFAGQRLDNPDLSAAPTGMTNRTAIAATRSCASHDTNGGVTAWTAQTVATTSLSAWQTQTVEIKAATADTTAPTITSATIDASGTTLTLAASEVISAGAGGSAGLTLTLSGGAGTAAYASGDGTDSIDYDLSRVVNTGEAGTYAYTQPGDGWQDAAGNDLATIASAAITNASTVPVAPAAPSDLAVVSAVGTNINLSWTDNASNEIGFEIEWDTVATFDATPQTETILTSDTETASVTVPESTPIWLRVRAYNAGGASAWSNTVSATTGAAPGATAVARSRVSMGNGLGL
jgi:hypothetical protein